MTPARAAEAMEAELPPFPTLAERTTVADRYAAPLWEGTDWDEVDFVGCVDLSPDVLDDLEATNHPPSRAEVEREEREAGREASIESRAEGRAERRAEDRAERWEP